MIRDFYGRPFLECVLMLYTRHAASQSNADDIEIYSVDACPYFKVSFSATRAALLSHQSVFRHCLI